MATVERREPIPKEDAQKWGITPEEELEIDQEALDRTIELMPRKMGLSFDELIDQEIRGNSGEEVLADKPGLSFDELVAKVEPFKQAEVQEMSIFYWLFTSLLMNGWADLALKDEPDLAK